MSMQELTEALRLIDANRDQSVFVGPRDPTLIAAAEAAIEGTFPPTYREFIQRLGAGNFGAFEVYGVIDADFEHSTVPDGIWYTLDLRRTGGLPKNLLVLADVGDGSLYCLELRGGREGPVVVYEPGIPAEKQRPEQVGKDFGEFLLEQVRNEL